MKVVLITGASRGIGKALSQRFLRAGYFVIGTSITGRLDYREENLRPIQLDLTDKASIDNCVTGIPIIDILINNAGALFDDGESTLSIDKLRLTLEVNLIGTADLTEQLIPKMNKAGKIFFVSSSAGSISETDYNTHSHHPNQYPAYKVSKAGLNMYMRTLAMRLIGKNIVGSIHPGWTRTDMGGDDAPLSAEEVAEDIFNLVTLDSLETGQFWFKGKKYSW